MADTSFTREYLKDYDKSVTEIHLIDGQKLPMQLEIEIYSKVPFITFSDKQLISVIYNNLKIYEMQKSVFELAWMAAEPID